LGRCVTLILCSFAGSLLSVTMKSNTL
jgi:hypothetical protein